MSYIPDYRKETDKLKEEDARLHFGYKIAVDEVESYFLDAEDENLLTVEREVMERVKNALLARLAVTEVELVCSLFEGEGYEGVELVDANSTDEARARGAGC